MRTITFVLALLSCSLGARAQSRTYRFLRSEDPVQDRNAYLLTLLEMDPAARAAISHDAALQEIGRRLTKTRDAVFSICRQAKSCPVDQIMLAQQEIEKVGVELAALAEPGGLLNNLVHDALRPSGRFQKYASLDDPALIRAAWLETADGVNRLYRVYALGGETADIDGPLYAAGSENLLYPLQAALSAEMDDSTGAFFSPWSRLGFDLLVVNQRQEAARYEPLDEGANRAAFAKAKSMDWTSHRYTAILVLGIGLSDTETGLSPSGAFLVRMAARRFRAGLAPFIIVSGGHVHPNRTAYSEAVEMKRELMARYLIPEDAIVIDPYARHTTTNLRNAARLLFEMGAPQDKPMMITSSDEGSEYIHSRGFADRCAMELGYQPVDILERVSQFDLAARSNIISLHADLRDPLDP
jgi:hypothetical protein